MIESISRQYQKLMASVDTVLSKKNQQQKDEYKLAEANHKRWLLENGYSSSHRFIEQSPELWPATLSPYPSYVAKKYCDQYGLNFLEMFKLNSFGLRSDEFTDAHDGEHILFAGCSVTFGDSMPIEYTWPYKVYTEISKGKKTSGFFNIARPGASNIWIIMQVMKYINLYGVPDTVFINFPDPERELGHTDESQRIQVVPAVIYQFLDSVISKSGGKLISVSWDARANSGYEGKMKLPLYDPRPWFNNFYMYDIDERHEYVYEFCEKHKNSKDLFLREFSLRAMDDTHPGAAEHDFLADFVMKAYRGLVKPKNPATNLKQLLGSEMGVRK